MSLNLQRKAGKIILFALAAAVDNPNMELMLVAELEGKVVGTLQMFRSSEQAYDKPEMGITSAIVRFLGVDPDVRGKGIAESLLRKSIELTQSWGENVLYLHTSDKMQVAIRLYERMGFERALDKEFVNQNGTHVKSYQYVIQKEQPSWFITSLVIKGRASPSGTALPFFNLRPQYKRPI
nr:GNAT family N-acetyltransferase [Bacillus pumilus]